MSDIYISSVRKGLKILQNIQSCEAQKFYQTEQ